MQTPRSESERPGAGQLYPLTQWSVVLRAQEKSSASLNTLLTAYAKPLYVYARAVNTTHHDAEDLVQGFFHHLLGRDFLAGVGPEKGRFRSFLLKSFDNYRRDQHDKANAQKRGGGQELVPLDHTESDLDTPPPVDANTVPASLEYDRAWARTVLANALARLEQEAEPTGHQAVCHALEPMLCDDEDAPSYRRLAEELRMTEGAVRVVAHRLRVRLRGIIKEELLQTVTNEADLQEEVAYLIGLFGR